MASTEKADPRREEPRSLRDLLDERRIVIPLPADSLDAALGALAAGFRPSSSGEGELRREVTAFDAGSLVALGEHAVLAHLRTEGVDGIAVGIGVAERTLPFAPETARGARVLVLVAARPTNTRAYLQALAALGRVLRSREVATALASARSPADVLAIAPLEEPILGPDLRVRDVMTVDVVSVGPDVPMSEVADLMVQRRLRALPVAGDEREVLGLITDRQVMEYFLPRIAGGEDGDARRSPDAPVRDVMLRSVLCVKEEESLRDVAALMINKDVERFPVSAEGALVGFLTRGDIIRKLLGGRGGRARTGEGRPRK